MRIVLLHLTAASPAYTASWRKWENFPGCWSLLNLSNLSNVPVSSSNSCVTRAFESDLTDRKVRRPDHAALISSFRENFKFYGYDFDDSWKSCLVFLCGTIFGSMWPSKHFRGERISSYCIGISYRDFFHHVWSRLMLTNIFEIFCLWITCLALCYKASF